MIMSDCFLVWCWSLTKYLKESKWQFGVQIVVGKSNVQVAAIKYA